jgi:hypothetical protein
VDQGLLDGQFHHCRLPHRAEQMKVQLCLRQQPQITSADRVPRSNPSLGRHYRTLSSTVRTGEDEHQNSCKTKESSRAEACEREAVDSSRRARAVMDAEVAGRCCPGDRAQQGCAE